MSFLVSDKHINNHQKVCKLTALDLMNDIKNAVQQTRKIMMMKMRKMKAYEAVKKWFEMQEKLDDKWSIENCPNKT